ncbi:MAG TPA: ankyrin repeat domain-containing protein [Bacteroidota bacterium]|jgi:ankyrin repeat protein
MIPKVFLLAIILFSIKAPGHPQDLSDALKRHDLGTAKTLIASGANVDQKGKDGIPPLVWATAWGDSTIVELLIQKRAKVNVNGDSMMSPLMEATARGYTGLVDMLLSAGADPNYSVKVRTSSTEVRDRTALLLAAVMGYGGIVSTLLDHDADVNFQADIHIDAASTEYSLKGETALMLAILKKHCEIVQILLARKADPDRQAEQMQNRYLTYMKDETALMVAARIRDTCCVRALLEARANINVENYNGVTVLSTACNGGDSTIVNLLLNHGADANFKASTTYNIGIMGELVRTIHLPYDMSIPILILGVVSKNSDVVKALLDHGANPDAVAPGNISPLLRAVLDTNIETIKLLLARKADPNIADKLGMNPLILASRKGCTECTKVLLEAGARTDAEDSNSGTALSYAKNSGSQQIINLLIKAGAKR